jgi:hypothetical protein
MDGVGGEANKVIVLNTQCQGIGGLGGMHDVMFI